jgi:hypothetical protein
MSRIHCINTQYTEPQKGETDMEQENVKKNQKKAKITAPYYPTMVRRFL